MNRKGGPGRPKGCKNKRNLEVEAIAARFAINPFEVLMMIAAGDWKGLGFKTKTTKVFTASGAMNEVENVPLNERNQAAKEASKYLYSQKNKVELTTGQEGFKIIVEDYSEK